MMMHPLEVALLSALYAISCSLVIVMTSPASNPLYLPAILGLVLLVATKLASLIL